MTPIDYYHKQCPNPVHDAERAASRWKWVWGTFLSFPSEGRTDILRCCKCGITIPRFIEPQVEPEKKHRRTGGPKPRRILRGEGEGLGWDANSHRRDVRNLVDAKEQIRDNER